MQYKKTFIYCATVSGERCVGPVRQSVVKEDCLAQLRITRLIQHFSQYFFRSSVDHHQLLTTLQVLPPDKQRLSSLFVLS